MRRDEREKPSTRKDAKKSRTRKNRKMRGWVVAIGTVALAALIGGAIMLLAPTESGPASTRPVAEEGIPGVAQTGAGDVPDTGPTVRPPQYSPQEDGSDTAELRSELEREADIAARSQQLIASAEGARNQAEFTLHQFEQGVPAGAMLPQLRAQVGQLRGITAGDIEYQAAETAIGQVDAALAQAQAAVEQESIPGVRAGMRMAITALENLLMVVRTA